MFDFLRIKEKFDFDDYIYFDSVDSTNLQAIELLKSGKKNFLIVAKRQTKGYGRFNRKWESEEGGLYFTFSYDSKRLAYPSQFFSIVCCMGVYNNLKNEIEDLTYRWPNDILVKDRKISGILLEYFDNIIVAGIGINVNNDRFPQNLEQIATSIYLQTGKKRKLEDLLFSVLMNIFQVKGYQEISKFLNESGMIGKRVRITSSEQIFEGKVIKFEEDGSIVLETSSGKKSFLAGDVKILR
ncbi:MAG: biotin--[acetyl-CoA-carboxylase] ligase [candidate division WOR-3 bacterium]|jgi:BirA family biotin operon repressor/biotin-[acetyl-CoA-carboxylase] ligase